MTQILYSYFFFLLSNYLAVSLNIELNDSGEQKTKLKFPMAFCLCHYIIFSCTVTGL